MLRKGSVSESDTNLLNSTVNLQGNPSQVIPSDPDESNPNVSVSGFIDESPYRGPGTHLQGLKQGLWEFFRGLRDYH